MWRRDAVLAGNRHSADEQKSRPNVKSFICTENRCLQRRGAAAAGEEHSADEQETRLRGDASSKNWRLGRSLAAQTHVLAVFVPPAPAAQSLGVASGVDSP